MYPFCVCVCVYGNWEHWGALLYKMKKNFLRISTLKLLSLSLSLPLILFYPWFSNSKFNLFRLIFAIIKCHRLLDFLQHFALFVPCYFAFGIFSFWYCLYSKLFSYTHRYLIRRYVVSICVIEKFTLKYVVRNSYNTQRKLNGILIASIISRKTR